MESNWDEIQANTLSVLKEPDEWMQYECNELLPLLFRGLIIYARTSDEKLVGSLVPMYQRTMQICSDETRRDFYTEFRDMLFNISPVPNAFMPFLLVETYRPIVAEATIDFAMMAGHPEDGLSSVKLLLSFLQNGSPANLGAMYGGLVFLGDPRVVEIIWDYRMNLSDEEVDEAARSRTEYPATDAFNFWLEWAEGLAANGDTESARFGSIVSAMAMIVRDDSVGSFSVIRRNFGYVHSKEDSPKEMDFIKTYSRKEYGGLILDRLYELEKVEAPPKLTSDVILRFGYEPKAPIWQQYRDAYNAK